MSRAGRTTPARVRKVRAESVVEEDDVLATEEPMEIRVVTSEDGEPRERSLSVTMRTPGNDFELAVGFLFGEGLMRSNRDVDRVVYCTSPILEQEYNVVSVHLRDGVRIDPHRLERHFYTTSSCGVCGKTSLEAVRVAASYAIPADRPRVRRDVIERLPERLRGDQEVFRATGGLHAAGLFDAGGRLECLREDVGRHNAVDKVVGQAVLAGRVPLSDRVLVVSGRASFEIVQKAAVAGIPVVVAVGAPSSLARELAKTFRMTLVGFARGETFNIYEGADRILGRR
ncbi:MAG: formate dehydrogenase accessory sulfurtransferase FdhD [Methanobacteriota archaeon]